MPEIPIRCKGNRTLPREQLKAFQGNLKTMDKGEADKLKKSILKLGWAFPVFVWNNCEILDGHGRLLVLDLLLKDGYTIGDIPVDDIQAETKEEAAELLLQANSHYQKITDEGLYEFMSENNIKIETLENVTLPDIKMDSFKANFFEESNENEDNAPEAPKIAKTKLGDLYELGSHRVLCGDATNKGHVKHLMNDENAVLIVTDPPYGVEYDPTWREGADLGIGKRSKGKVTNDDRVDWGEALALIDAPVIYLWHAGKYTKEVQISLEKLNYEVISQIIWAKQHFVLSRGDYHWQHEPCLYAVKKGSKHNWQGKRDQSTVWNIENNNAFGGSGENKSGHGTQKPIACMERPIKNNSKEGDLIVDMFLGSGTTLIACEKTGRKCYGIEIDPIYCDVIVSRWCEYTETNKIKLNGKEITWTPN